MSSPVIIASFPKNARETLRVSLDTYRDTNLLDVRVAIPLTGHTGTLCPTAKGVSVNVALIPQLRAALADAEAKAREMGWL